MKDLPLSSTSVLCWPKRLLSADDLRRHLTSQRELSLLPRTVVTPLAADELRAKGVRITWQVPQAKEAAPTKAAWIYAQEKPDVMIGAAIRALQHDGVALTPLEISGPPATWLQAIKAAQLGGIVF